MPMPMSSPYRENGSSTPQSMKSPPADDRVQGNASSVSQIPERSGLPSAIRGAGAVRLGLPSASLGIPAVGYFSHCAPIGTDRTQRPAAVNASTIDRTLDTRIVFSITEPFYDSGQRIDAHPSLTLNARHTVLACNRSEEHTSELQSPY